MSAMPPQLSSEPITYRQLDHWVRRGYLRPTGGTCGSGYMRDWTDAEIRVARRMGRLVAAGFRTAAAAGIARHGDSYLRLSPHVVIRLAS